MGSWLDFDRGKALHATDMHDIAQSLAAAAAYLGHLTQSVGKQTNRQLDRAREALSDAAQDAQDNLKDNVLVSLVVAAGVGLVIGYLFGRSSRDM
jgi:ElaB/YqjD/DUF883 family membrane-anchored ribosome-binding protein